MLDIVVSSEKDIYQKMIWGVKVKITLDDFKSATSDTPFDWQHRADFSVDNDTWAKIYALSAQLEIKPKTWFLRAVSLYRRLEGLNLEIVTTGGEHDLTMDFVKRHFQAYSVNQPVLKPISDHMKYTSPVSI